MTSHVHCCDEVDYDSVAEQAVRNFLDSKAERALMDALDTKYVCDVTGGPWESGEVMLVGRFLVQALREVAP